MQIILIDKIINLGKLGDLVKVKSGYARNFLIPQKKALLANQKNIEYVKSFINTINLDLQKKIEYYKSIVEKIKKIDKLTIFAKVGKQGKLFGSINHKNIIKAIEKKTNILLEKKQIKLPNGSIIKKSGIYVINLYFSDVIKTNLIIEIKNKK